MHEHQGMREVKECVAESLSQKYLHGTLHKNILQTYRENSQGHSQLYPFNLNSYALSVFFSDNTPRGHDPRTAWRIAGVAFSGGLMTRMIVCETNEMAKGILLSICGPVWCEMLLPEPAGAGAKGTAGEAGIGSLENEMAKRSSRS